MKTIKDSRGFFALSIVLIIFPIAWFILDINDIPSKIGIPPQFLPGQWSTILIGYYSSTLAAIVGFIATAYSVKKTILFQANSRKEDNAIAALPLARISCDANNSKTCDSVLECKYDNLESKNKVFSLGNVFNLSSARIELRNVGQREMYNVRAKCIKSGSFIEADIYSELAPIIYKDDYIIIGLNIRTAILKKHIDRGGEIICSSTDPTESIIISLIFDDCYGNSYEQLVKTDVTYYLQKIGRKYYQAFNNSKVKTCRIISAPRKI